MCIGLLSSSIARNDASRGFIRSMPTPLSMEVGFYARRRQGIDLADRHQRGHSLLVVGRQVADEEVSAGLGQVHGSLLGGAGNNVWTVAGLHDAGVFLLDVRIPIGGVDRRL